MTTRSERGAAFIPRCPACEYDLSGTPGERCPECGGLFNRAKVLSGPAPIQDGWPQNILLVAAILIGVQELDFLRWVLVVQAAVVWSLATAWMYVRRRSILGPKPWLVLWMAAVGLVSADLLDDAVGVRCGVYFAASLTCAAVGFCVVRRPKKSVSIALELLGSALFLVGVSMAATAVISVILPTWPTIGGADIRLIAVLVGPPIAGLGLLLLVASTHVDRPES